MRGREREREKERERGRKERERTTSNLKAGHSVPNTKFKQVNNN